MHAPQPPSPRPARARRSRRFRVLAVTGAIGVAAGVTALAVVPAQATRSPQQHRFPTIRNVSANLFEWNWPSVAAECKNHLGPAGYGSVQVSPPQDSLSRDYTSSDAPILHPWWDVYQPADYNLTSRFGGPAAFRSMVRTCRSAGVKVIVDAVINHMTGQGTKSYGGETFTKYDYPGLYTAANFHSYPRDCPVPPDSGSGSLEGSIADFNNYTQLTKCELLGLSDLRTDTAYVRGKIDGYLNKLISYGVSGFRIDAAKHIGQTDLAAIERGLHRTWEGTRPFIALEVFPGSPGEGSQWAYTTVGHVLGFDASYQLYNAFKSYTTPATGSISSLRVWGAAAGLIPSDKSFVFVENHDTERGGNPSTLNYRDGATNTIANEFLLAYGYGTPQVYSGFAFDADKTWEAPPSNPQTGYVYNTNCDNGQWVCVDRYQGVVGLVGFHNYVGNSPIRNWYDDKANFDAFGRGDRGYFAINNATTSKTVTLQTGLRPGTYCDVVHGHVSGGRCTGPTVHVNGAGRATITVAGKDSVAIDGASRL